MTIVSDQLRALANALDGVRGTLTVNLHLTREHEPDDLPVIIDRLDRRDDPVLLTSNNGAAIRYHMPVDQGNGHVTVFFSVDLLGTPLNPYRESEDDACELAEVTDGQIVEACRQIGGRTDDTPEAA